MVFESTNWSDYKVVGFTSTFGELFSTSHRAQQPMPSELSEEVLVSALA